MSLFDVLVNNKITAIEKYREVHTNYENQREELHQTLFKKEQELSEHIRLLNTITKEKHYGGFPDSIYFYWKTQFMVRKDHLNLHGSLKINKIYEKQRVVEMWLEKSYIDLYNLLKEKGANPLMLHQIRKFSVADLRQHCNGNLQTQNAKLQDNENRRVD